MSPLLAKSLVFVASAAVLVVEILAVRLAAPHLGVSLETFTAIIGVMLAGISVGAWLGGREADRRDPTTLPGPLLIAGGLTALVSPLIIDAVGPTLSPGPASSVIAALASFFLPATVLSAVPPVIVKIQLSSLDDTGSVVGSYSAIGTAGALFGTFVTGFVLIAAFPTRPIVAALGIGLALTGALLAGTRKSWALLAGSVVLGLGLWIVAGPCEHETTYHCANVVADDDHPTGRTLMLDRFRNSYVDLADPTHLEFRYIQTMADVFEPNVPVGPLTVVSIGGGGATLPGYIEATRPGSTNIVLEIDGALIEVVRSEMSLSDEIEVIEGDARLTLGRVEAGEVALVVGDAFQGASVPWHLTTVEYNEDISRVLRTDGVYIMNVIDYGDRRFARAAAASLLEVFPHVAALAPPAYFAGPRGGNFVLAASKGPLDLDMVLERVRRRSGAEIVITGQELDDFIGDSPLLTDDYAPVDQLLSRP